MDYVVNLKVHRVLVLEDNEADYDLLVATLSESKVPFDFVHTRGQADFETAIKNEPFDLIVSDYSLPSYNGLVALAHARQFQPDTPFVFVSGTIGEERAIEGLKSGATDYVLKDRPGRLVPAIMRALHEAQARNERDELEAQLRQSQKLEAIGQLAGGAAHDFNNLLAVIQGYAELGLTSLEEKDVTRDSFKQISAAVERAANLTRQLLAFGRRQPMRQQAIDLNTAIDNFGKMMRRVIGENISLKCSYKAEPAFVCADVAMMEQVLLNLALNARDAMPKGGSLVIETTKVAAATVPKEERKHGNSEGFIRMTVSDTGTGIAPEHLSRIFEPFFTTKEVGKGTGLGLAMVYGIVKQHEGWIDVRSKPGAGTTFNVYLPAISPPKTPGTPDVVTADLLDGTETILLVEDDQGLRELTRQMLGTYGYHVLEAGTAKEALEVWHKWKDSIDLLLTDIVMPGGMSGLELGEQLRKDDPLLKVVYISGYSAEILGKQIASVESKDVRFLAKPFQPHALAVLIRKCFKEGTAPKPWLV